MIVRPYGRPTLWSSELMIVRTYGCPVKIKNLWFDLMVVHVDGCLVDGCLLTVFTINIQGGQRGRYYQPIIDHL